MLLNRKFIEETIARRERKNDFVREFSFRHKGSPINEWNEPEPYTKEAFQKIYGQPLVDGVKLKFRYTTLTINGRHSNK